MEQNGASLEISLFGPFAACVGGAPLPRLRSRRDAWLLALLVLRGGRDVERSWLAGTLWPESEEAVALGNLRRCLTDLRRALGAEAARLRSPTRHTLRFDLAGAAVDVIAFDAAITREDPSALEEAIALYRGPLLEGCAEEWVFQERQAREEAWFAALETLARQAEERGERGEAERWLRLVVAADPLRESAQRSLMATLTSGGSYAAALLAYRELRGRLHQELNVEPDPETRRLFEEIRAEARRRAHAPQTSGQPAPSPTSAPPRLLTVEGEGTVTFLFTDIEESTRLWEEHPQAMPRALARHDALLRAIIEAHGGVLFKTVGDQCCAAFAQAPDALAAALASQRALGAEPWEAAGPLRVRMAVHSGTALEREGDYFGPTLSRAARLLAVGHGGQVLLSLAAAELARDTLPEGAELRDLQEHRLKDLARPERIFQLVAPGLPAEFPALNTLGSYRQNLPLQLTSFIGREKEIAAVKEYLGTTRLLTLTGSGGCGKTRLAFQVAAEVVEAYAEGVWLVELAALAAPPLVAQTVAAGLGVREEPSRPVMETLVAYLQSRTLLLVLDNCEHLLGACAELTDALLRSCPGLHILVTSREGLGIAGERTYRVPSLSLPEQASRARHQTPEELLQCEAVRLFVERALFVQPSFAITAQNGAAVAQICQRLDGIPLAIELAAARVKVLPVDKLNERLADMFGLLTAGSRTALPRHQTLRALIEWSYDLLTETERTLLRRLSVFAGGWTLEAAEAACAGEGIEERQVLDLLTALVDKCLVLIDEQGGDARYRLLETIRQYGRDRLMESGEWKAQRGRHLELFLRLAWEDPQNDERWESELDNLRIALEWCKSEDPVAGLHLMGKLRWFWPHRGYVSEGREHLTELLSREEAGERTSERALALRSAGWLAMAQGDYGTARSWSEESLIICRDLGEPWGIADSLTSLAHIAMQQDDLASTLALAEEALAISRGTGYRLFIENSVGLLAEVHYARGEYEVARLRFEERLAIGREMGWLNSIAWALVGLGNVARAQANYPIARSHYAEGLRLFREARDKASVSMVLVRLAALAVTCAESDRGAHLFGAAEALREVLGSAISPKSRAEFYEASVAATRLALGEAAFSAAWAEGRALTMEEAVALALEEDESQTDSLTMSDFSVG